MQMDDPHRMVKKTHKQQAAAILRAVGKTLPEMEHAEVSAMIRHIM